VKFTNETDQPVRFRRTHRFGDEQPTIVTVEPGKSLDPGHTYTFERLDGAPAADVWDDPELLAALARARAFLAPPIVAVQLVTPTSEVVPAQG
jgi:hypothetical protein